MDALEEIRASLESAPLGDPGIDQVMGWLFAAQNCLAARLSRVLQDKVARNLLTDTASRTWQRVSASKGDAQRLWEMMTREVQHVLDDPTSYPQWAEGKARQCLDNLAGPVAIPEDLLGPGPPSAIKHRKEYTEWVDRRVRLSDPRILPAPVLGDFCAANVLNRLYWLSDGAARCRMIALRDVPHPPELRPAVDAAGAALWDAPDAGEIGNACVILQVYLGATHCRSPDWTVLPVTMPHHVACPEAHDWPIVSESLLGISPKGVRGWVNTKQIFRLLIEARVERRPREVVSVVKGALEWLADALGPREYRLFTPDFSIIPPETSFPEAWENFCCEALNLHENTTHIRRRPPPDQGVDLLWHDQGIAWQCKSVKSDSGKFPVTIDLRVVNVTCHSSSSAA